MTKRSKQESAGDSKSNENTAEIAGDLRLISAALRGMAGHAARDMERSRVLLALAGWTIFRGRKLFHNVLDLSHVIDEATLRVLERAIPKLLPKEFIRDTVEDYLKRLDAQNTQHVTTVFSKETIALLNRSFTKQNQRDKTDVPRQRGQGPAAEVLGTIDGYLLSVEAADKAEWQNTETELNNYTATGIVRKLWDYLAPKYKDTLPPDTMCAFVDDALAPSPQRRNASDFVREAWVCEFLLDQIDQNGVDEQPGLIQVSKASRLTHIDEGTLSRACTDGEIKGNGKKGPARRLRLESLMRFREGYDRRKKAREEKNEQSRPKSRTEYECSECGESYPVKPEKCPHCPAGTFKQIKKPLV